MVRTVQATRYVTPLREGGSLPAIVEADDDGLYVLKFRGAGQGQKALIAELVAGEIGRAIGLPVPEIVLVELDPELERAEPDQEIAELLAASAGLNLGLDYLPGSLAYNPVVGSASAGTELASAVVWFDAFVSNVDRTPRNPNLLLWHRRLWLIDHGAALYVHHAWSKESDPLADAGDRFPFIKDHVLLPLAGALAEADEKLHALLTPDRLAAIVSAIPDAWLGGPSPFASPEAERAAYVTYLTRRLASPRGFVEEALHARTRR
jgi:hypothetical protein